MQRLGDQLLGRRRAVAVGGVDDLHAGVDGVAQHPDGAAAIGRIAPDPAAGDAHRPEAQPVHLDVPEQDGLCWHEAQPTLLPWPDCSSPCGRRPEIIERIGALPRHKQPACGGWPGVELARHTALLR